MWFVKCTYPMRVCLNVIVSSFGNFCVHSISLVDDSFVLSYKGNNIII